MVRRYLRFSQDEIPNPQVWTPVNLSAQIISGNGRDVRLRSTPKVDSSNVLGLYPVGRTVMVLESSNDGWSHIRIDRKNGYMMSRFLTTGSVSPAVPVPAPSPYVPFIPSNVLNSASLSNTAPSVGETITILVSPAAAEYTAIWYRDDNQLLSTNSWYTVGMLDLGHVIYVRITGLGHSAGVVLNLNTAAVSPSSSGWGVPYVDNIKITDEMQQTGL